MSLDAAICKISCCSCRAIATDEHGTAWVGSEAGNIKCICLKIAQEANGSSRVWLEVASTFKRNSLSRQASQLYTSCVDSLPEEHGQVNSAHVDDPAGVEEGSTGWLAVDRAHAGPVSAIESHAGRLLSSGGTQSSATVLMWDSNGILLSSHSLKELGMLSLLMPCE